MSFLCFLNSRSGWSAVWLLGATTVLAQSPAPAPGNALPLNDLSAFRQPVANNWRVAADAAADPAQPNNLTDRKGTGVLVNLPAKPQYGQQFNLVTQLEHGDADLELDYLLARGSNSGVYLQGRYEVQLYDSWGVRTPTVVDNGAIYERWDDARPAGQQGFEGHPPRQNASRAPGLWQHLKISFQAPRFDAAGRKVENARILRVELNGVTVQENVELTGPTRAAAFADEKPTGPLMLQGDHGPVAFRNIRYVAYDKPRPELMNLQYSVYKGKFEQEPNYNTAAPEAKGPTSELTAGVTPLSNEFLIRYVGTLRVKEPGTYTFNLGVPGGGGALRINKQPVITRAEWGRTAQATLPAGDLPFELVYAKLVDWAPAALGLAVSGPGIREFGMATNAIAPDNGPDPILVPAETNTILRSFMDLPNVTTSSVNAAGQRQPGRPHRVTHAVSVGSPERVHYTYDLDNGALVQLWRGTFLDATPMWHDRGDGSSRPTGMVQRFGRPTLTIGKLASQGANWPADTVGSGFRPKGYVLDEADRPTFRYVVYGAAVNDQLRVLEGGQGLRRDVTVDGPTTDLYVRVAEGSRIEPGPGGSYVVDDKTYYVRLNDAGGANPSIRDVNGRQELILPLRNKLSYSILF